MKKFILWCILATVTMTPAIAQHAHAGKTVAKAEKAPEAVIQAFQQNFSDVSEATWHMMASGNWYADFSQNSMPTKAEFTPDGQWVATRSALTAVQLPDTIHTALQQKYPGSTVSQATLIRRADVAPYYLIALEIGGNEKDVLANDKGAITE
jgi:hypothetical protein